MGLSDIVLRALPDAPLQPLLSRLGKNGNSSVSAKAWLRAADPALRDVIAKEALQYKKGHISQVISIANRSRKLTKLNDYKNDCLNISYIFELLLHT